MRSAAEPVLPQVCWPCPCMGHTSSSLHWVPFQRHFRANSWLSTFSAYPKAAEIQESPWVGFNSLAKLAFCLLDLPLSHGVLSALGRDAGTLVNHRAMAPISLLTSPGQQWKSLCLLSMQIKIIAANNEKLNGCHWAKPKCYTVASLASQGFLPWATFFSNHLYLSKRYSYCTWVFWIIE